MVLLSEADLRDGDSEGPDDILPSSPVLVTIA